ncbi:MAG TPA: endonuclease III domain-containing protein [Desulfohalobiaceae bacterium]|nr:endonuclease III domain-containing protein [Desulfohalobiaceae bacterium]
MSRKALLMEMFQAMHEALGPSGWWPAETSFEVCLGALLTQNTNWSNVEKAIQGLKEKDLLHPQPLLSLPDETLAELIRPVGYFRVKADRVKSFLSFLQVEVGFDLDLFMDYPMVTLRDKLLSVRGIGPETADSMLLYAFHRPSFVVDAYTARILQRHLLIAEDTDYHEMRSFFMDVLSEDVKLYNEYHALLVRVGKHWCKKKKGLCQTCPLGPLLERTI